jgi:hypothetical protein
LKGTFGTSNVVKGTFRTFNGRKVPFSRLRLPVGLLREDAYGFVHRSGAGTADSV